MQVITDHLNLYRFLTTNILFCRKTKWWEHLFSLDFAIEYYEKKSNSIDKPFCWPEYIDKDNKLMYIVDYVTCLFAKRI